MGVRASEKALTPNLVGGFGHEAQLRLLILGAEEITADGAGKSALGAERKLFVRDEFRRFINPPPDRVLAFAYRRLGAHQPEDSELILGQEAQRLEAARARIVVLE